MAGFRRRICSMACEKSWRLREIGVMLPERGRAVCFSATVNFAGSIVLGTAGVVTLTKVKHRRELLFAALPLLFAIHQFIEGFVWLGLDGIFSLAVAHDMGARSCFMHRDCCRSWRR